MKLNKQRWTQFQSNIFHNGNMLQLHKMYTWFNESFSSNYLKLYVLPFQVVSLYSWVAHGYRNRVVSNWVYLFETPCIFVTNRSIRCKSHLGGCAGVANPDIPNSQEALLMLSLNVLLLNVMLLFSGIYPEQPYSILCVCTFNACSWLSFILLGHNLPKLYTCSSLNLHS